MKRISIFTALLFILGLVTAGMSVAAGDYRGAQAGQFDGMDDISTFSLNDRHGQNIGEIDKVLVDVERGQIGYVVVESAAGETHVIPWQALQADPHAQTLTLQMDAAQFRQAPTGDAEVVLDPERAEQIHQFYGVAPHWDEEEARLVAPQPRPATPEQREVPPIRSLD